MSYIVDLTKENSTKENSTEKDSTEEDSTEKDLAEEDSSDDDSTEEDSSDDDCTEEALPILTPPSSVHEQHDDIFELRDAYRAITLYGTFCDKERALFSLSQGTAKGNL